MNRYSRTRAELAGDLQSISELRECIREARKELQRRKAVCMGVMKREGIQQLTSNGVTVCIIPARSGRMHRKEYLKIKGGHLSRGADDPEEQTPKK